MRQQRRGFGACAPKIHPPGVHGQAGVSRATTYGSKFCSPQISRVNKFLRTVQAALPCHCFLAVNRTSARNGCECPEVVISHEDPAQGACPAQEWTLLAQVSRGALARRTWSARR